MGGWEAVGGSGEADRRRCSCGREARGLSREEMVVVMTCGVLRETKKMFSSECPHKEQLLKGLHIAPVGNAGNVKFFTFNMAWKYFCYVSGLLHKYNNHMIV